MAEEQAPPPRRTLGDYVMYQRPMIFSSIAMPNTVKTLEMKPAFHTLISTHQFTTLDHEDAYSHLSKFYELVGTMGFHYDDMENVYMSLIPFSLTGKE